MLVRLLEAGNRQGENDKSSGRQDKGTWGRRGRHGIAREKVVGGRAELCLEGCGGTVGFPSR